MTLQGDDSVGWTWTVQVDDEDLFRTEPLARDDLAAALFSIQRDASRTNTSFRELSDEEVFGLLDGFFFGKLHDALRASAEEQVWARHLVSPAISAAVPARMYLVGDGGAHERVLVWWGGKRRAFTVAAGSFDEALKSIRERLEP
jgi:hypothetical protein